MHNRFAEFVHRAGRSLFAVGRRAVTIRTSRAALALLVAAAAWLPSANAQALETFRARRAQSQAPAAPGAETSVPGLEGAEGIPGKFVLPAGGRVERDVSYGSDPAQKLDVYLPRDGKQAPILVMVHGGAWMLGDKGNTGVVANKVRHWLPQGYIVVSLNYRMSRPPSPLSNRPRTSDARSPSSRRVLPTGAATHRESSSWAIRRARTSWLY